MPDNININVINEIINSLEDDIKQDKKGEYEDKEFEDE